MGIGVFQYYRRWAATAFRHLWSIADALGGVVGATTGIVVHFSPAAS